MAFADPRGGRGGLPQELVCLFRLRPTTGADEVWSCAAVDSPAEVTAGVETDVEACVEAVVRSGVEDEMYVEVKA